MNKSSKLDFFSKKTIEDEYDYNYSGNDYKELYWTNLVQTLLWHDIVGTGVNDKKINIPAYRENKADVDLFLPKMVQILSENFGINIEEVVKYFILDEKAKKILEIQFNIFNSVEQVEKTISSKTEKIELISISNEKLAEKIGDLFYDSLSSFISSLGENIDNSKISRLLEDASKNIMNAWNICFPYVSHDFPEMKHASEIKGINIDKQELVKRIGNLIDSELKDFLEKLSAKIQRDGEADKGRGRIKLSNELFSCADKLKQASGLLK